MHAEKHGKMSRDRGFFCIGLCKGTKENRIRMQNDGIFRGDCSFIEDICLLLFLLELVR